MSELHPGARRAIEESRSQAQLWEVPIAETRRRNDDEAVSDWGALDDVAEVADIEIDGIRARVYRPAAEAALPGVVYLHGGGWVAGSIVSHDPVCRALAARTPAVVVSVDYRLAPEHRFPAAAEDAWTATRWVSARAPELGIDPARLVVAGDSAGGNLAAVVAVRARDAGLPLALQVLIYPVTDADLDSPGYTRHGEDTNLTRAKMEWFWGHYLGDADGSHPDASPLRTDDLAAVAPALVQTAEFDPLAHEADAYARRLLDAGVPATVTEYAGQIHGFVSLRALCGEQADEAVAEIAAAVRGAGSPR